jgi:uncharacterized DUF497 family protein
MENDRQGFHAASGFEWDETKRRTNLAKHDLDFRRVVLLFDGRPTFTERSPYPSEERFLTTGILDDVFVTAVWTWRGTIIRFISARRARHEERRKYRNLHESGN